MKEFNASTTINASPETIWAILTNADAYPEWDPGMQRLEGRVAAGEKITAHTKYSTRAFPVVVSTFDPPRKMVWSGGMPMGLFKGERTFTLTPQGNGVTQFSLREAFSGPLEGMMSRSVPDLSPHFEKFVAGLKKRAESQG